MVPVTCDDCGAHGMVWDPGWHIVHVSGDMIKLCPACAKDLKDPAGELHEAFKYTDNHPLQNEFGFTVPEDGSEERFKERGQKYNVPWAKHTFYWVLHNNIAHFLIGILPIKTFFKFHDWTSRKMHGK